MRLEMASSLSGWAWSLVGGGGHTIRLSIMSSVDVFITEARSGGSVVVSQLDEEEPLPIVNCCLACRSRDDILRIIHLL